VQENAENKDRHCVSAGREMLALRFELIRGRSKQLSAALRVCQPAMGDMDGRPGIGQIGIDPDQQVQVVSERSQDNLNPGESLQQSTSTA
jgi:hypothetical protein